MINNDPGFLKNQIFVALNQTFGERRINEKQFTDIAQTMREALKSICPVSDDVFENMCRGLREQLVVDIDPGVCIRDTKSDHQSWLPARRSDIEFFYWNRYRKYLENEGKWTPRMTSGLGKVSDEILDLCGDPEEDNFAIRGLILGDIQSGKTANYTGVINKAADAGYRVVIVLAGITENLRIQTQIRLDKEFTGRNSVRFIDPKAPKTTSKVGVGITDPRKLAASFTSAKKDFRKTILDNLSLGLDSFNEPVLFVMKKNKDSLNNLLDWLNPGRVASPDSRINLPMLLVDDEADNGSINTNSADNDATRINRQIRELLNIFSRSTYLGITATPFANIFIDPDNDDDLFPSDFIYALTPPANYIGAERIFGCSSSNEKGEYAQALVPINGNRLKECFPIKHKSDYTVSELPEDLYESAYYFLLANALRDIRGDQRQHRSMLVHLSRFTKVQNQITEILTEWLDQVKSDVLNYGKLPEKMSSQIESIRSLKAVWDKYGLEKKAGMLWPCFLRDYLYPAISPIDVRSVNMSTGASSLDYSAHSKDGMRVIAVGGNSLSRGLTLEGLMVTYFNRTTKMYDTLLQMGRWFGYRPNYDDLMKIWMTEEMKDWFGFITEVTEELKQQIIQMRSLNESPSSFGLKVRKSPDGLMITAPNKMRSASEIKVPVTVAGHLLETPKLKASKKILEKNEKLFRSFVNKLATIGTKVEDEEITRKNHLWKGVPAENVAELVSSFETNPWHMSFNSSGLSEYIRDQEWPEGWDVVLMNKGEGSPYPKEGFTYGHSVLKLAHTARRSIVADKKTVMVSGTKLRVGSRGITKIGLTKQEEQAAASAFLSIPENEKKNVPDYAYLTEGRRPLLMLHVIEADYKENSGQNLPDYLFAIGLGFPGSRDSTKEAKFMVNKVELENWGEEDSFKEEDEE